MDKKFEQIMIIRDTMIEDPTINSSLVWNAAKIANEDKYLYDLMIDWMKETNSYSKQMMQDEILNYTEEILRKMKVKV